MDLFFKAWKNCFNYQGRATRQEFWLFFIFNLVVYFLLTFAESLIVGITLNDRFPIAFLYYLASMLPLYAVGIRRMHDTDHSGWFMLIPLINLVFLITEGTRGDNIYGPDPKWRQ